MAQTVFDVQELCDHICDNIALLASSYDDLRSTALVCRTLSMSAQSRIFRHIILEPYLLAPGPAKIRTRDSAIQSVISASIRLSTILSASPHLLRFTHHLRIRAQSKVLFPLSNIRFPALRKLCLTFSRTATLHDSDAFHLARDFVGLPSIRDVRLVSLSDNPEPEGLGAIFDMSTPHIDSVTFVSIFFPTLPSVPRPREQRAQIKRLKLVSSDELDPWLISPQCPFDFSRLVHVVVEANEAPALLQILTSARLTITHLALFGAITTQVNLSEFPALTCLELRHSHWQPLHSLGLDNCLESLVLYFLSYAFQTDRALLSEMDTFVANFPMPSLRKVEVRFRGEKSELEAITSYCPRLLARGLLAVTTHPDRTRSA
ncbi:hypothetical protein DFH09DRAFT_1177844 [Mycena vulgaris]|nr:hypothetical protein DFH09DRAFT_1177844 [Mycena vulgaris]